MFIGEKQREKHVRENDHCNSVKINKTRPVSLNNELPHGVCQAKNVRFHLKL